MESLYTSFYRLAINIETDSPKMQSRDAPLTIALFAIRFVIVTVPSEKPGSNLVNDIFHRPNALGAGGGDYFDFRRVSVVDGNALIDKAPDKTDDLVPAPDGR